MGLLKESLKVKDQWEEAINETSDGAKCLMGIRQLPNFPGGVGHFRGRKNAN